MFSLGLSIKVEQFLRLFCFFSFFAGFFGGWVGINILQKTVLVAFRLVALYTMEKSHKTLEARIWLLN